MIIIQRTIHFEMFDVAANHFTFAFCVPLPGVNLRKSNASRGRHEFNTPARHKRYLKSVRS